MYEKITGNSMSLDALLTQAGIDADEYSDEEEQPEIDEKQAAKNARNSAEELTSLPTIPSFLKPGKRGAKRTAPASKGFSEDDEGGFKVTFRVSPDGEATLETEDDSSSSRPVAFGSSRHNAKSNSLAKRSNTYSARRPGARTAGTGVPNMPYGASNPYGQPFMGSMPGIPAGGFMPFFMPYPVSFPTDYGVRRPLPTVAYDTFGRPLNEDAFTRSSQDGHHALSNRAAGAASAAQQRSNAQMRNSISSQSSPLSDPMVDLNPLSSGDVARISAASNRPQAQSAPFNRGGVLVDAAGNVVAKVPGSASAQIPGTQANPLGTMPSGPFGASQQTAVMKGLQTPPQVAGLTVSPDGRLGSIMSNVANNPAYTGVITPLGTNGFPAGAPSSPSLLGTNGTPATLAGAKGAVSPEATAAAEAMKREMNSAANSHKRAMRTMRIALIIVCTIALLAASAVAYGAVTGSFNLFGGAPSNNSASKQSSATSAGASGGSSGSSASSAASSGQSQASNSSSASASESKPSSQGGSASGGSASGGTTPPSPSLAGEAVFRYILTTVDNQHPTATETVIFNEKGLCVQSSIVAEFDNPESAKAFSDRVRNDYGKQCISSYSEGNTAYVVVDMSANRLDRSEYEAALREVVDKLEVL